MEDAITDLKRGKLPAVPVELKFDDLINPTELPPLPEAFGHDYFIEDDKWGMLGNGSDPTVRPPYNHGCGCCVFAGRAHETMIFNKARGIDVPFGTVTTVDDYGTVTGYKPGHPATDRGTTVVEAADYSRKTGLSDAYGKRHKIAAYMELDPGNMTNLFYAVYLGMAVGIGWRLPSIADEQFAEGKPWDFTGQDTGTGHYTPFTHHSKQWDYVISWGKRIRVKRGKGGIGSSYCDEAIVYVTQENLVNQKSPEGFDYEQLMEFLGSLRSA